jgi:hypothetical protein
MAILNFLNLADEVEVEEDNGHTIGEEELLQDVIHEYIGVQSTQDDEDDEQPIQPVYSVSNALQAVQVLIGFTEGQESLSTDNLRVLERLESRIEAIQQASLVQSILDSWIT